MAKTLIVFLLDNTGSMQGREKQVQDGYVEYLKTLREDENADDMRFTLILFNSTSYAKLCDGAMLKDAPALIYKPHSSTPLFDALGRTIEDAHAYVTAKRGFGGQKRQRVNVVVLTDGLENASSDHTLKDIQELIQEKEQSQGWAFTYLAEDIDVWDQGQMMGISVSNTLNYTGDVQIAMAAAAISNKRYVSTGGLQQQDLVTDTDKEE